MCYAQNACQSESEKHQWPVLRNSVFSTYPWLGFNPCGHPHSNPPSVFLQLYWHGLVALHSFTSENRGIFKYY